MITILDCLKDDNPNCSLTLLGGVLGCFAGVGALAVPIDVQLLIENFPAPQIGLVKGYYLSLTPRNLSLSLHERTA